MRENFAVYNIFDKMSNLYYHIDGIVAANDIRRNVKDIL